MPSAAQDRRYLFAAAAQAMRQVLVDHARRRGAVKRDGGGQRVPLDQVLQFFEDRRLDIVALHEALDRLMALDERQGLVVSLRFFVGLSVAEVADVLDVSVGTVEGDWRIALRLASHATRWRNGVLTSTDCRRFYVRHFLFDFF